MNKTTTFFVDQTSNNLRLDKYLASKLKILTRSQIKKIIISKSVKDEIGDEYKTRKLAPIEVKGKRKPVDIFKVLT